MRCRRESKECFFSATRRKRKNEDGDGGEDSLDGYEQYNDDYIVRNGRKMAQPSPPPPLPVSVRQSSMGAPPSRSAPWSDNSPVMQGPPLTPGGSIGRSQPLRRPTQAQREQAQREERNAEEANTHVENLEAQEVMRREVYGPHDALDLLYKAATDRYVLCDPSPKRYMLISPIAQGIIGPKAAVKCLLYLILMTPEHFHNRHLCNMPTVLSNRTTCLPQKLAEMLLLTQH